jgi:hypothetical protein
MEVKVQKIYSLDFLPKGETLISWSAAYNGSLLFLMLDGKLDKQNIYKIYIVHSEDIKIVKLGPLPENFHLVQLLPNNEILLVRVRANSDQDQNAHIYNLEGQSKLSFPIGDGVEDVQVADNGDIWVSYFDEGVHSGSKLSYAGLSAFNSEGEIFYQYSSEKLELRIDDCYAFNLCSSNEVWCYYYAPFPLVRIKDKIAEVITAQTPVAGARAFAVNENLTLYYGSYEHRNSLLLHNRKQYSTQKVVPVNESGKVLSSFEASGRRNVLWLYSENSIYRLEVGKEI